ncbi:hypothetical protein DXA02_02930 [Ruminococcus sp. AM54-1NS]|nr:hypothetical protein DXA02_02930 [Ruminococcus sp. AM54-1NS]
MCLTNDRNSFAKVYRMLINMILVYDVKILTMQAAIIKIGKIFWGKVAISVKTQVSYCFMFKANKYAVLSSSDLVKMINQYCANYQYIYMQ